MEIVITLVILLFSAVIHEVCHGVVAYRLGDDTAKVSGRLTLNPIPHLDLFGSILLPLFLYVAGSPILFGSAKPVPVNFMRLRDPKKGMALVSLAGPASNFVLAIIFAIPLRFGQISPSSQVFDIFATAVILNLSLGIFNLLPIPPLDGFKVLAALVSRDLMGIYRFLEYERFGFLLIIVLLYSGIIHSVLVPILSFVAKFLMGFPLI